MKKKLFVLFFVLIGAVNVFSVEISAYIIEIAQPKGDSARYILNNVVGGSVQTFPRVTLYVKRTTPWWNKFSQLLDVGSLVTYEKTYNTYTEVDEYAIVEIMTPRNQVYRLSNMQEFYPYRSLFRAAFTVPYWKEAERRARGG